MRTLNAADVLGIVEHGSRHSPTSTVLRILDLAQASDDAFDLAVVPIGERDRALLRVRQDTLGDAMEVVVSCPQCAARLEFSMRCADLIGTRPDVDDAALWLHCGALIAHFRLPTSEDLFAIESYSNHVEASRALAMRCVRTLTRDAIPVDVSLPEARLSENEIEALSEAMTAADPHADFAVELHCEACSHRFEKELDPARFFLDELEALAKRLLTEICALARGYGWSEADILSMSGWRRRIYLEMLG